MAETLLVDPRFLRLPPSRFVGADPVKLSRQFSRFGKSIAGMPDLEVTRGANGLLMLNDGVTRATRVAKYLPGVHVRVTVIDTCPNRDFSGYPTVGDRLP
jgi:hypothetical protein